MNLSNWIVGNSHTKRHQRHSPQTHQLHKFFKRKLKINLVKLKDLLKKKEKCASKWGGKKSFNTNFDRQSISVVQSQPIPASVTLWLLVEQSRLSKKNKKRTQKIWYRFDSGSGGAGAHYRSQDGGRGLHYQVIIDIIILIVIIDIVILIVINLCDHDYCLHYQVINVIVIFIVIIFIVIFAIMPLHLLHHCHLCKQCHLDFHSDNHNHNWFHDLRMLQWNKNNK